MAIEHNVIPDGERHEPKGLASATSGQVYVASGSDVGVWGKPTAANTTIADSGSHFTGTTVETALQELAPTIHYLQGVIPDISTASHIFMPLPADGVVSTVESVIQVAITGADAVLTVSRPSDNATLATVTVTQAGSAIGDLDTVTATSNVATLVKATQKYIKVATNGGSTTACPAYITIKYTT